MDRETASRAGRRRGSGGESRASAGSLVPFSWVVRASDVLVGSGDSCEGGQGAPVETRRWRQGRAMAARWTMGVVDGGEVGPVYS